MGREIRRVPADWQHPKRRTFNHRGQFVESYHPMFDRPYGEAIREWIDEFEAWERGERADYAKGETMPFWEWHAAPPDPAYYRPDWPEESRTHLMMYEDTSEGTPISPAFKTPEEVARWCADNGASAFGRSTASYEAWLNIARGGFAPSMVYTPETGLVNGVSASLSPAAPQAQEKDHG